MKGLKFAFALATLVALAGVIGWRLLKPSDEPVYEGRTLTEWLMDRKKTLYLDLEDESLGPIKEAVNHMGTNAIPTLLRLLRTKDSALKVKVMDLLARQHFIEVQFTPAEDYQQAARLGFMVLGTNATSAGPALIRIANEDIPPRSRQHAIGSLRAIDPPADWLYQLDTNGLSMEPYVAWRWVYRPIDHEAAAKAGTTNSP